MANKKKKKKKKKKAAEEDGTEEVKMAPLNTSSLNITYQLNCILVPLVALKTNECCSIGPVVIFHISAIMWNVAN